MEENRLAVNGALGKSRNPHAGLVCGIHARNDARRGVWKAAASGVCGGVLCFERDVNSAQQQLLLSIDVN